MMWSSAVPDTTPSCPRSDTARQLVTWAPIPGELIVPSPGPWQELAFEVHGRRAELDPMRGFDPSSIEPPAEQAEDDEERDDDAEDSDQQVVDVDRHGQALGERLFVDRRKLLLRADDPYRVAHGKRCCRPEQIVEGRQPIGGPDIAFDKDSCRCRDGYQ